MDPLDSRITMEMVIEQERKLRDTLRVASVTVKGRDPKSATSAVWLVESGYIPQSGDHIFHEGELVLRDWNMVCFYRQTHHWELLGLES